jgi:hypothetical protein
MCFERCPAETIIDLDTARIEKVGGPGFRFHLSGRCVGCLVQYRLLTLLRLNNIHPHQEPVTACRIKGCVRPPFRRYQSCFNHLSTELLGKGNGAEDIELLRRMFKSATSREWTVHDKYKIVQNRVKEIKESKRPGTDLIVLDDE